MTVPGFTAEASLYQTRGHYYQAAGETFSQRRRPVALAQVDFSAEASLYARSGHYQMTASWVGGDATRVNPVQIECLPCRRGRRVCCRPGPEIGEPEVCWSESCHCVPTTVCYPHPDDPRCTVCDRDNCDGTGATWTTCGPGTL